MHSLTPLTGRRTIGRTPWVALSLGQPERSGNLVKALGENAADVPALNDPDHSDKPGEGRLDLEAFILRELGYR